MKILIVDDNHENRYLLQTLLNGSGYETVVASNGAAALKLVRAEPVDMIVSDILMPVKDGFQLCREVKSDSELASIPFVVLTATYIDDEDEKLALGLGADAYVRKPVNPEEFVGIIQQVLRTTGKTTTATDDSPLPPDTETFKLYNERLIRKLEKKMLELEDEITKRRETERLLQHRIDFERIVSRISGMFINIKPHSIHDMVNMSLDLIGDFLGLDRCYIFDFTDDGTMMNNTYEWCNETVEPHIDNLQNLSVDIFPWWMERLRQFETINIPRVADMPQEAHAEKELLESQDIRSLLVVPLIANDRLTGYVGFDMVREERTWRKDDIALLEMIADIVVNAFERVRYKERLVNSEVKYRTTFDTAGSALAVIEDDMTISMVNREFSRLTGYAREDIQGTKKWPEIVTPEYVDLMRDYHHKRRTDPDSVPRNYEFQYIDKSGDVRDVLINIALVPNTRQSIASLHDITEHKRVLREIRESEEKYRQLFETMLRGVVYQDANGKIISANPAAEKILGLSLDQLQGQTSIDPRWRFVHEDGSDFTGKDHPSMIALTTGEEVHDVVMGVFNPNDNSHHWIRIDAVPQFRGDNPAPHQVYTTFEDITERRQAEKALQESEKRYRTLFETAAEGILIADLERRMFKYANPAICTLLGYSREELLTMGVADIHPPGDLERIMADFMAQARGEQPRADTIPCLRKDGTVIYANVTTTKAVIDGIECNIGFFNDITERKKAEESLRKSRTQLSNAMEIARLGYWEYDVADDLFTFDEHLYSIFRTTAEEIGGYTISSAEYAERFIHPDDRDIVANETRKAIETTDPDFTRQIEHRVLFADGELGYISVRFHIIKDEQGHTIKTCGANQDITERRRSEEERIRLVTAIEQSHDSIIITDAASHIQYVNAAFEKVTGYSPSESIGHTPRILKSGEHDEQFYEQLWNTILQGKVWDGRFINRKKDGTLFHEDATISPVIDANGKITNFVAVKRDITNKLMMEQHFRHSQKMEAVGTLAGGIAHDFNNILSSIVGYAELAMDQVDDGSTLQADLDRIYKAGYRAKNLVDQLLTFSRQRETEAKPIQLSPIIKESLKLIRSSFPANIEVRYTVHDKLPLVTADPAQVHQMLINLCSNAERAMRKQGGILEVNVATIDIDGGVNGDKPDLKPGSYLHLQVQDTGCGIDSEILDKIFDPYFTTKDKSSGGGLGLAVVHGIVQGYGGTITIQSEPEKGTVVHVYLPTAQQATGEIETMEIPTGGNEHILLIDDEQDLIGVGRRMLERMGYRVTTMESSPEALDLIQQDPEAFDVVITDMTMPFMTGDELAKEILRLRHDMPIILTTGYSEKMSEEDALAMGIRTYLKKPFRASEINAAIDRALNRKHSE